MKIFLNDRIIHFVVTAPAGLQETDMVFLYGSGSISGPWEDFNRYDKFKNFYIVSANGEKDMDSSPAEQHEFSRAFREFISLFKYVPAAGGLVKNEKEELLFIHRYGHWDLPKGKIGAKDGLIRRKKINQSRSEKERKSGLWEKIYSDNVTHMLAVAEKAAVREVREETGLSRVKIIRRLPDTWHIYSGKSSGFLKQTFWFEMEADSSQVLKPQVTEGIFLVKWTSMNGIHCILSHTYASIRELLLNELF